MRGNRPVLTMIIMAAAATDFLDGRIARAFHQVSKIGRILDPLADKAMQAVMLACLMVALSAGKAGSDPVCGEGNLYACDGLEGHDGDRSDRRSTVAWKVEYRSFLCGRHGSDGGSETSVLDGKRTDRSMCGMYGNVLCDVCI